MTPGTWLGQRAGQARCARFVCHAPRDAHCRIHSPAHCPGQCPDAWPGPDETLTQWLLAGQPVTGRTTEMPAEFPTITAFYDHTPIRATSPESDYGVHWIEDDATFPMWRVSYIKATGEVYAVRLHGNARVVVLGTVVPDPGPGIYYHTLDHILRGWAELPAEKRRLSWVAGRLHDASTALTLAEPAVLTRDVTRDERTRPPRDFRKGELLWTYHGVTYGVVDHETGIAMTEVRGETPFIEFPKDAVHICADCASIEAEVRVGRIRDRFGQRLGCGPGEDLAADPDSYDRNGATDGTQVISDADPGL